MTEKLHGFKYDLFLGGPPDRRVCEPYRQMFFEAFPDLNIYDWEKYQGADYQAQNHRALKESFMMVAMAPRFPFPAVAEEVGYFYAQHEYRVNYCRQGLHLNFEPFRTGGAPLTEEKENFVQLTSPPINPIILIWPNRINPKFAQKTLLQVADIVSTTRRAIKLMKANLAYLEAWKNDFYPHIKKCYALRELESLTDHNIDRSRKDLFYQLATVNPRILRSHLKQLLARIDGQNKTPDELASGIIDLMQANDPNLFKPRVSKTPPLHPGPEKAPLTPMPEPLVRKGGPYREKPGKKR